MSSDLRYFDRLPAEPHRLMWCEWLRRHGIDPRDVLVPGWVERDEDTYAVRYLGVERDATGEIVLRDGNMAQVCRVQLEGRPLPWPKDGRS